MSEKEDEIVQKVELILKYSTKIKQDIALQQFLHFNFTNEFKEKTLTLPTKKRERESYKFIDQYVKLIYSLFQKFILEFVILSSIFILSLSVIIS